MKLTIIAINRDGSIEPPRTKKTSPRIVPGLKHPILLPSAAYCKWEKAAIRSLLGAGIIGRAPGEKPIYGPRYREPIDCPVNCRALIYRDALRGDAVGFFQAIGDFLQLAGIVENDRFIVSWDGSRMLKDSVRPRIEIELSPVGEMQNELF